MTPFLPARVLRCGNAATSRSSAPFRRSRRLPHEARVARDVLLGAALGLTRDYVAGTRLIERALNELSPRALGITTPFTIRRSSRGCARTTARPSMRPRAELRSADPNNRARAHILLSWIALRRGEILRQVDELQKALDELDSAEAADQYFRANALFTLALLCRELPLREVADRVRSIFEGLPWTKGLTARAFSGNAVPRRNRRARRKRACGFRGF